jgi:hypothetical protein
VWQELSISPVQSWAGARGRTRTSGPRSFSSTVLSLFLSVTVNGSCARRSLRLLQPVYSCSRFPMLLHLTLHAL